MSFANLREARRHLSLKDFRGLHKKAEQAVEDLQKSELHLIKTLQVIEDHKVHRWCGYNSLFEYGVQCLGLSRSQSYMYMSLSKATRKYQKLELALCENKLTASKASRVLSVMTVENQQEWITKAMVLPKSQLEKEVVRLNPKKARGERFEYLTTEVVEMKTPVSEGVYELLVKVQDLLSGSWGRAVRMEEVFEHLAKEYLQKKDPLERAKRHEKKLAKKQAEQNAKPVERNEAEKEKWKWKEKEEESQKAKRKRNENKIENEIGNEIVSEKMNEKSNVEKGQEKTQNLENRKKGGLVPTKKTPTGQTPVNKASTGEVPTNKVSASFPARDQWGQRLPIPQEVVHGVHLRDQRQCRHHYPSGERCKSTRWIHLHHKKPIAMGGQHSLENIITLCPFHHDLAHLLMEDRGSVKKPKARLVEKLLKESR